MNFRQSVIEIEKNGSIKDIYFLQPFNKLGLHYEFSFSKTFGEVSTMMELSLYNVGGDTVGLFSFDPLSLTSRPKVSVYAGYSKAKPKSASEIGEVKKSLPLVFSGYPFFVSEVFELTEKRLDVKLTDRMALAEDSKNRVVALFQAGTNLKEILATLSKQSGQAFDTAAITNILNQKIDNSLLLTGQHIFRYVMPLLGRRFGFTFNFKPTGEVLFLPTTPALAQGKVVLSADTGLVQIPLRQNWTQWQVETFFGMPEVLFPGDWVTVQSRALTGYGVSESGTVTGLVVGADYSFGKEASVMYTIATDGVPGSGSMPIIEV